MIARLSFVCLVLSALSLPTSAGDWPQFRGPERTGISEETGLLREWPADGPQLVWRVDELGPVAPRVDGAGNDDASSEMTNAERDGDIDVTRRGCESLPSQSVFSQPRSVAAALGRCRRGPT